MIEELSHLQTGISLIQSLLPLANLVSHRIAITDETFRLLIQLPHFLRVILHSGLGGLLLFQVGLSVRFVLGTLIAQQVELLLAHPRLRFRRVRQILLSLLRQIQLLVTIINGSLQIVPSSLSK